MYLKSFRETRSITPTKIGNILLLCCIFLGGCISGPPLLIEKNKFYENDLQIIVKDKNAKIRLGMKKEEIIRIFGEDLEADFYKISISKYTAALFYRNEAVTGIMIGRDTNRPALSYETFRGIKIGDSYQKVLDAYPADSAFVYTNNHATKQ